MILGDKNLLSTYFFFAFIVVNIMCWHRHFNYLVKINATKSRQCPPYNAWYLWNKRRRYLLHKNKKINSISKQKDYYNEKPLKIVGLDCRKLNLTIDIQMLMLPQKHPNSLRVFFRQIFKFVPPFQYYDIAWTITFNQIVDRWTE